MRLRHKWVIVAVTAIVGQLGGLCVSAAAAPATTTGATVISATNSPFGKILVVGSGKYTGYTVYMLTSDNPPSYGCTTTAQQLPPGPLTCTGPEGGQSEWPAVSRRLGHRSPGVVYSRASLGWCLAATSGPIR